MAGERSKRVETSTAKTSRKTTAAVSRGSEEGPICSESILEAAITGLSGCSEDALSKAVCRGIIDPNDVVAWTDRTERLVRFQFDRAELRSEIPAVASRLRELLGRVSLPSNTTPLAVTERFIGSLVAIRGMISDDLEAAFVGDPAANSYEEIAVAYPAVRCLAIHRLAHDLYGQGVALIPRIMSEYAHDRTGIDINPGARIGRRFFIDHGTGVVIGETTEIGDNVRLYQGVTLGATSLRDSSSLRGVKRHPTVEDDVTIYAGAKILGGNTVIGAGSVIGGNVWLTESVPPGSRVMVEPPRNQVRQSGNDETPSQQLRWDL